MRKTQMLFEEEEFLIISSRWQEEGGVCLMDMSFGPLLSWSIGFYFLGKKIIINEENLLSKLKVSLHSKKIVSESMKCEINLKSVFSIYTNQRCWYAGCPSVFIRPSNILRISALNSRWCFISLDLTAYLGISGM